VDANNSATFEATITLNSGVASFMEITHIGSDAQQTTNVRGLNFVSGIVQNNTFDVNANPPLFDFLSTAYGSQGGTFYLRFDSSASGGHSFTVNSNINNVALSVTGTFTSATFSLITVPGAPTGVAGKSGNQIADLSWDAPNSNGGSAITSYTVTAYDNGSLVKTTTGITSTDAVIERLTNGTEYTFRVQAINIAGGSALSDFSTPVTPSVVICFAEGTRLLTQNGYKAVETLTSEDRLVTTEGRTTSLQLMTIYVPCTTKDTAPYVVAAGALGENMPIAPLYLSPLHKFLIRDNIWGYPTTGVKMGLDIKQYAVGQAVNYYHVRCENYARDVILAEGVPTESFGTDKEDRATFAFNKKTGVFTRKPYKESSKSRKA